MIITFVHHSCFVVETDERVMIFDYFKKGNMHPPCPSSVKISYLPSIMDPISAITAPLMHCLKSDTSHIVLFIPLLQQTDDLN